MARSYALCQASVILIANTINCDQRWKTDGIDSLPTCLWRVSICNTTALAGEPLFPISVFGKREFFITPGISDISDIKNRSFAFEKHPKSLSNFWDAFHLQNVFLSDFNR